MVGRKQAIDHLRQVRKRLKVQTADNIAKRARARSSDKLSAYVEELGWRAVKRLQENDDRRRFHGGGGLGSILPNPDNENEMEAWHKFKSDLEDNFERFANERAAEIFDLYFTVEGTSLRFGELEEGHLGRLIADREEEAASITQERDRLVAVRGAMCEAGARTVAELGPRIVELYDQEPAVPAAS